MPGFSIPAPPAAGWRGSGGVKGVAVAAASKLWPGVSVPRSVSGAIGVLVAFDAMNAAMEAHVQETFEDAQDMVGSVALELLGRIQRRTPVDTGRARASWHAVMPGESDKYTYRDTGRHRFWDGSKYVTRALARGVTQFVGDIGVSAGPLEAWVGSNVSYMEFLEAGSSRQAPNGMVAISVLELSAGLGSAGASR